MKKDRDKKIKDKDQLRQIHQQELVDKFKGLTATQAKAVMKIVQFDTLKGVIKDLKNLKNTTPDIWKAHMNKLMAISKIRIMQGANEFDICSFIETLMNLLAMFVGANLAFKCNEKSTAKAAEPTPEDSASDMYDTGRISADSVILTYCKNKEHNFCFYARTEDEIEKETPATENNLPYLFCPCDFVTQYKINHTSVPDIAGNKTTAEIYDACPYARSLYNNIRAGDLSYRSDCPYIINRYDEFYPGETPKDCSVFELCPCKVSMCEPEQKAPIAPQPAGSEYIAVEYDVERPKKYMVEVGQVINVDDIIGEIDGIPVKSKIHATVEFKNDDFFVAKKVTDASIDVGSLTEQYNTQEIDDIAKKFEKDSFITSFLKDYLVYTRIPDIVLHTREHNKGNDSEISAEKYLEKYNKISSNIITGINDKIQEICQKENVESKVKNGQLMSIKDDIMSVKKKGLADLISHYNGYNNIKYCSKGRITDFLLYDHYLNYIAGDDFFYDDKNPYVVRLYHLISKYIGKRSVLEKGRDNIGSMSQKFKELCNECISEFVPDKDYYEFIKSHFKYLYYSADENGVSEADINDEGRVTLYSKVYDFLKTLVGYTEPQQENIEYTEGMDTMSVLNENKESTQDRSLETKLKKIAINFVMLRIAETNFKTVNNASIRNAITEKKDYEYYNGYKSNDEEYNKKIDSLQRYLKSLQRMSESESFELTALAKEAIEWYNKYDEEIITGRIFDPLKQVSWPPSTAIYNKDTEIEYYYLKGEDYTVPEIPKAEDMEKLEEEMSKGNNYIKSGAGPGDYLYWLVYMGWATLVNCMIPIYWSTGLIIAGAPMPLPIIFIPIYVLSGRIITVFGIGLCGICPLPMILFVNMSNTPGTIIFPINTVIDTIRMTLNAILGIMTKKLTLTLQPPITALDVEIKNTENQIKEIDQKLIQLKNMSNIDYKILRKLDRAVGEESTTQKMKETD